MFVDAIKTSAVVDNRNRHLRITYPNCRVKLARKERIDSSKIPYIMRTLKFENIYKNSMIPYGEHRIYRGIDTDLLRIHIERCRRYDMKELEILKEKVVHDIAYLVAATMDRCDGLCGNRRGLSNTSINLKKYGVEADLMACKKEVDDLREKYTATYIRLYNEDKSPDNIEGIRLLNCALFVEKIRAERKYGCSTIVYPTTSVPTVK
jgi:hypothetical protein